MEMEAAPDSITIGNIQHMGQLNNVCLSENLYLSFQYLLENEVEKNQY